MALNLVSLRVLTKISHTGRTVKRRSPRGNLFILFGDVFRLTRGYIPYTLAARFMVAGAKIRRALWGKLSTLLFKSVRTLLNHKLFRHLAATYVLYSHTQARTIRLPNFSMVALPSSSNSQITASKVNVSREVIEREFVWIGLLSRGSICNAQIVHSNQQEIACTTKRKKRMGLPDWPKRYPFQRMDMSSLYDSPEHRSLDFHCKIMKTYPFSTNKKLTIVVLFCLGHVFERFHRAISNFIQTLKPFYMLALFLAL